MPNFIFGGISGALTWVIASLFILLTNGGYTPGKYLFNLVFFIIFLVVQKYGFISDNAANLACFHGKKCKTFL
jgi:hypothetical protein